ncbi:MAG: phage major capsid protein [Oscillospiraceae bacterium]|nr:phage major capsid protein [Oscillospiraceae bacterium]
MIKILALEKKRTAKQTLLKQLRARRAKLRADETELEAKLDAAEDVDDDLQQQIDQLEADQNEVDDQIDQVLQDIDDLQQQIDALEDGEPADDSDSDEDPEPASGASNKSRSAKLNGRPKGARSMPKSAHFRCRSRCFSSREQRDAFYANDNVRAFIGRVRTMLGSQPGQMNRRSVTGAELTIPTEYLEVLRDNIDQYSKLLKYTRQRDVKGKARQNIIGEVPEGVWMEMAGALNELTFTINEVEADGFKVGGIVIIDNFLLEDSDIALGEEILYQLGQAEGLAVDKSIPYGKGKTKKMPLGFISRLAQTEQPEDWGDNRREWKDLHSTNILKLDLAAAQGAAFFTPLLGALAKAKTHGTGGERVWIMNEATKIDILIRSLGIDAAAAIVAGMNNTMPIIGGVIETEEFMPDFHIAGGCLEAYLSVKREGGTLAYSDLPLFIQDKTVFKGTARRDGMPIFDEDFVLVCYNNTDPVTEMSFARDAAGDGLNALIITAAAGAASGATKLSIAGKVSEDYALMVKAGVVENGIRAGQLLDKSWTKLAANGNVTAAAGVPVTVVELDEDGKVVSFGTVSSVPKA